MAEPTVKELEEIFENCRYREYTEIKGLGVITKFCYEIKDGKRYLTIEQEGNKVYLRKYHIERMPRYIERWKVD